MGAIASELKDHILTYVSPEKGVVKISDGDIPILIKSYYVSKGVSYTDISLYMLGMQVMLMEDEYSRPKIQFTSLAFFERYDGMDSIKYEELNAMVAGQKSIALPIRRP
ncbi:hypothetical protein HWV01_13075 [Moritella sp. 5]|uniref:hypothetical protein n=1 Tax=Moritella sp. 5 TaxID=2746231 RepID=UPI001BA9E7A2|nr:hypothetical protein [Moritella sp. 5]QUM81151.1 hypothetical protein HWV01_13075 [Moritella sp. 5]